MYPVSGLSEESKGNVRQCTIFWDPGSQICQVVLCYDKRHTGIYIVNQEIPIREPSKAISMFVQNLLNSLNIKLPYQFHIECLTVWTFKRWADITSQKLYKSHKGTYCEGHPKFQVFWNMSEGIY